MNDNHEESSTEGYTSLSKVAALSNLRIVNKKVARITVFIILMMMVVLYLTTKGHVHKKTVEPSNTNPNMYTLQENLNALERMQKEALEQQKAHVPNYTATTDGLKIGHPKAIRHHPKHDEMDAELITRMNAPTTFINVDEPSNHGHKNPELAPMMAGTDANSTFLNAKNSIDRVDAVALPHPEHTLSAGEFIPATLETAVNSELPGMVRALTARDVYALTGNRVLIPKGSRLIGQYSSGNVGDAQTRVLISWTRVQLPNGVVVTLNSPSADSLGRAGQGADSIDRHFIERFSAGFLFSVLGATTATLGVNQSEEFNSASAYRMGLANSFQDSARESLQQTKRIQPTLHIDQGAAINVFVARDLNFFNVARS
jgi:type IV secretion system protein VirB10